MCDVTTVKSRKKTGYKVLAFKDGKYYSSFTGQEIKIGKVPDPPEFMKRLSGHWLGNEDMQFIHLGFYKHSFAGKISAFLKKEDAIELFESVFARRNDPHYDIHVVKITLAGDVYKGSYNIVDDIIASDMIKSITKI